MEPRLSLNHPIPVDFRHRSDSWPPEAVHWEIFSCLGPPKTTKPHKTWLNMLTYPSPKSVHPGNSSEASLRRVLLQLPRDTVNSVSQQLWLQWSGGLLSALPLSPTLKFSNFSWIVIWKFRDPDSTLRDCYSTGLSHGLGICMFSQHLMIPRRSIALDLTQTFGSTDRHSISRSNIL